MSNQIVKPKTNKQKKVESLKIWIMKITVIPITDRALGPISKKGARGVMVIVVGNGQGDTSSNPGRD